MGFKRSWVQIPPARPRTDEGKRMRDEMGPRPLLFILQPSSFIPSYAQCRNCGSAQRREVDAVQRRYADAQRVRGKLSILHHRSQCWRGDGPGCAVGYTERAIKIGKS